MSDGDFIAELTDLAKREVVRVLLGKQLGSGAFRTVFENKFDPTTVVKIETGGQNFYNIREWEFWKDCSHVKDVARWLAPCVDISPCGFALVMRRTTPVPKHRLPAKLPEFLTDFKEENFGILNGKFVCHDYGHHITRAGLKLQRTGWHP